MPFYTYMVRCADGTLYTGWTLDVDKRVAAHNAGRGAKYTRSRPPRVEPGLPDEARRDALGMADQAAAPGRKRSSLPVPAKGDGIT